MGSRTISISVDETLARRYAAASREDRKRLELLLSMRLRELTAPGMRPLREIMDEVAAEAKSRGLTQAKLESLLDEV